MTANEARNAHHRQYMKKYRAKNREKVNRYQREWKRANPEKVKKYNRRFWERKAEQMSRERKGE